MTHPLDGNTHALNAHLAEQEAARAGDEDGERCNVGGCNGHMRFDDGEGDLTCDECERSEQNG